MPLLSVSAHEIEVAGVSIDRSLPVEWLAAELAEAQATAVSPGHVTARLSRSGEDIVVRGRVAATVTLPCARCLDPAETVVDTELALLLTPVPPERPAGKAHAKAAPQPPRGTAHGEGSTRTNGASKPRKEREPEEVEFTAADAERDTFDGETVVLDEFVREAILLELPNFPLCSEACPGIRPAPSDASAPAENPLDPRLSPLRALRARMAMEGSAPNGASSPAKGTSAPRPKKKKPKE